MKWPWVSRALHEAIVRDDNVLIDAFREAKIVAQHGERDANARYDALLARYHQLKLQSFSEPEQRVITPTVAPVRDAVMLAVNAACGGKDIKVRSDMLKQVDRDRAAGVPDAEIVQRILRGNRPMDEFSDTNSTANPGATASVS